MPNRREPLTSTSVTSTRQSVTLSRQQKCVEVTFLGGGVAEHDWACVEVTYRSDVLQWQVYGSFKLQKP